MEKRELYEERTIMIELSDGCTLVDRKMISITEEEIVKPYLEKLKEQIKDNTYFINETTEKEGIDFETVEKIIDNLLTEKGIEVESEDKYDKNKLE